MIRADHLQYITGKKLNKSDDKIIAAFETYHPHVIDAESGIRGITIEKPNSTNYLYFSEKLQNEQLASRAPEKLCERYRKHRPFRKALTRRRVFQSDSG